jgi:hypothetical protein
LFHKRAFFPEDNECFYYAFPRDTSGRGSPSHQCRGGPPTFPKSPGRELRISKKDRIDSWEFRKKTGSTAENFKKRPDRFLRIPEKDRIIS